MMILYASTTSPFVRKVQVLVHERNLAERVRVELTNPSRAEAALTSRNPLGKIPALVTDGGAALYDSRVICAYLDSLDGGPFFHPTEPPRRWPCERRIALGDGIMEAAVLIVLERRREASLQSEAWIDSRKAGVVRALESLEGEAATDHFDPDLTMGELTIACALEYLDFRLPELAWRTGRPALATWQAHIAKRPSFASSKPREG